MFDPALPQHAHRTDEIAVSYLTLFDIVGVDFAFDQSFTPPRPSPFADDGTQAAQSSLIGSEVLIDIFLLRFYGIQHALKFLYPLIIAHRNLILHLFEDLLFSLLMQFLLQLRLLSLLSLIMPDTLLMQGQDTLIPHIIFRMQAFDLLGNQLVLSHEICGVVQGFDKNSILH